MIYFVDKHVIKGSELMNKEFSFSSSSYKEINTKNKNLIPLKNLLSRKLKNTDKGLELAKYYTKGTKHYFLRTGSLQNFSLIPVIDDQILEINPKEIRKMNLKKDDILISKDSNIGQTSILEKNYENFMISSGIYRLPLEKHKKYIFAFMKNALFIEQLEALTPRGTTLTHAKTLFLDCLVPFPNKNIEKTINLIEKIIDSIILKEQLILDRHKKISEYFYRELHNNSLNKFEDTSITFREMKKIGRFNSDVYSKDKKALENLIKNYKNGFYYLNENDLKIGTTPKNRVIDITKSLLYSWVTPSNSSDYGYLQHFERIEHSLKNNLKNNALLLINRTSRGSTGKYVGIALFYDYTLYGPGHHNQGMYRYENEDNQELLYLTAYFNSKIIREYCSYLALGTKMKELKSREFSQIPIPKIDKNSKENIVMLMSNKDSLLDLQNLNFKNFDEKNLKFNNEAGILELSVIIKIFRSKLDSLFDQILLDEEIDESFTI